MAFKSYSQNLKKSYQVVFEKKLKNDVLILLEHIFPNTYWRIKKHISPAMVGTGC